MSSDNIDFVVNGELFLRKNPDKYYSIEGGLTNRKSGITLKETVDYSKMGVFWQLDVDNEKN